jgi:Protein kinase domain
MRILAVAAYLCLAANARVVKTQLPAALSDFIPNTGAHLHSRGKRKALEISNGVTDATTVEDGIKQARTAQVADEVTHLDGDGVNPLSEPDAARNLVPADPAAVTLEGSASTTPLESEVTDISYLFDPANSYKGYGTRVGDYFSILTKIGSGSFGKVLRVRHKTTQSTYVAKIIMNGRENKIIKEVMISHLLLTHPGIVRAYGYYFSPETPHPTMHPTIIMEDLSSWINGEKLLLDYGPLSEDSARVIFRQLVDAIGFMHSKGYAHNDIKGNLSLTQRRTSCSKRLMMSPLESN